MKLNQKEVEKLFEECNHQSDVIIGIYKMVFPQWNDIEKIDGWPTINKETSEKLFKLFIAFDKKYHPGVMAGGLWMKNGFSTLAGDNLALWEVDSETCKVIMV